MSHPQNAPVIRDARAERGHHPSVAMRPALRWRVVDNRAMAAFVLLILAVGAIAQDDDPDPKKKKKPPYLALDLNQPIRLGFRPYADNDRYYRYKAGVWNPVYIPVKAGEDGVKVGKLTVETPDNEEVKTTYTTGFSLQPLETRILTTYVRPGNISAEVKATIDADGRGYAAPSGANALPLRSLLIVTLGSKMQDLQETLVKMAQGGNRNPNDFNQESTAPRFAGYEVDANLLPASWVGYQSVDLAVLSSEKEKFVEDLLAGDQVQFAALAQWVRRGGRLVLPISWKSQPLVARLLKSPVWQPALPTTIPETPGPLGQNSVDALEADILGWAEAGLSERGRFGPMLSGNKNDKRIHLALLRDPKAATPADWEVLASVKGKNSPPVIVRMPCGLGNVTLIAFPLDQAPFTSWGGRHGFWAKLLNESLYKLTDSGVVNQGGFIQKGVRFRNGRQVFEEEEGPDTDVIASVYTALDNFDIRVIPFGWVALFILLYIVLVGPLDYLILRFLFGRLEWTWFTFPLIVAGVTVAAYYTAYLLKGEELKINQVDVVDFDLRTGLDEKGQPRGSRAYGTTFYDLLSPRVQNYTMAVEPNPLFWGQELKKPLFADNISWLSKARGDLETSRGAQSFFRRPYQFDNVGEDGASLVGVPMGVWMTKAFTASWEAPLPTPPLHAELVYYTQDQNPKVRLEGKIRNLMPVDLEDVYIFYRNKLIQLGDLPARAKDDAKVRIEQSSLDYGNWPNQPAARDGPARIKTGKGDYDPTAAIKKMMFHNKIADANQSNHLFRTLDQSWRLRDTTDVLELRPREAIVYARVPFRSGQAEALSRNAEQPLPTLLWMSKPGPTRPALQGQLNQDTYVRFIVPVLSSVN